MTGRWRVSPVSSFGQLKSSDTDRTLSGGAPDVGVHASGPLQRGSREAFS